MANAENNGNIDEHAAKLELFFNRKFEQDKIKRKIKKKDSPPTKKQKKQLTFDFDEKQYRLTDKNDVAVVSVKRIARKNEVDFLGKKRDQITSNKKKILKTKYEFLFEYQNIESYGTIFDNEIGPLEESNKKGQKIIEEKEMEEKKQLESIHSSKNNFLAEKEGYRGELKNNVSQDRSIKAQLMENYIEKQSELYGLKEYEESAINKLIKETTIRTK